MTDKLAAAREGDARGPVLSLQFTCPDTARVGEIALLPVIQAIFSNDDRSLAQERAKYTGCPQAFELFAAGLRCLAAGDAVAAAGRFACVATKEWQIAAPVFRAMALGAAGNLSEAFAIANRASDIVTELAKEGAASLLGDRALVRAGVECLAAAEAAYPPTLAPFRGAAPFYYLISYPRSGNTLLRSFLSFAFTAPAYSVYPGDGRYFSRRFHQAAPGHPVFVKDHRWRDEYMDDEIVLVVRDGRDSVLSYARFLYAEGSHKFVGRDEFADFLSFVAANMPFGFWSDHTRAVLNARDRGARVRLVRYEEIFRNYRGLLALARELANGVLAPRDDEQGYAAHVATAKRAAEMTPVWSQTIALPRDSYIPQNWSMGGGTLDWRSAFDAAARRRFHELGGTDMLMRLGYEADESWWRDG